MGHECKEYYKGKDGRIYERKRWVRFQWQTIIWGPGSSSESKDNQECRDLDLRDALILFSVLHLSDPDFLPDDSWHELCFEV